MPGFLTGPVTGFVDRMKGKGLASSSFLQQIGRSSAQSAGGGSIGFFGGSAGNGADTTADTLYSASIPANFFDIAGRCLTIQLAGTVALTSATKTIAFVWGGGSLNQSIVSYATTNGGSWQAFIQIFKTGASTQTAIFQADATGTTASLLGAAAAGRQVVVNTGGTETDTAAILFKVTGQSSVATANLAVLNIAQLDGYN